MNINTKNFKRGSTGLLWEHQNRFHEYIRILNGSSNYSSILKKVMTFKEVEIVFKLPHNTVIQDFKKGIFKKTTVRKSGNTYLITLHEAKRHYEDYWSTRAKKNISHLYSSYDGKKMSEDEYFIRFNERVEAKTLVKQDKI
ncbi:hypothetical protein QUD12_04420 [Staphylococcus hyicus]|uniref:hypothetical protein n=1 Tax=Staphylococcus hyicus TaxID=1284 RepID=UPI00211CF2DC|nr:hypothetical protein [Staphylococcus hyicus]MCQ9301395.1 hypothetical protein [Staphylococcus hyicus]MDP4448321.1 hypothetical protein [Staphylococcus hyicus]MDP4459763.1 hypothetical protein [Staphylococcus hyicus]MDP4468674.1 hypothetical protein [Staphylococcus hyicus]